MRLDSRGTVLVEYVIALLPVMLFAFSTYQLIELYRAKLLVNHSASVAARSAALVLSDDPAMYQGVPQNTFSGPRQTEVELAASLVLVASPHFRSKPIVRVSPSAADGVVSVTVEAPYHCLTKAWSFICPGQPRLLKAASSYPSQFARYQY